MDRTVQWGATLVSPARLERAVLQDIARCQAEDWPFDWRAPGPRPGTEAEEQRRLDVRRAVIAEETALAQAELNAERAGRLRAALSWWSS